MLRVLPDGTCEAQAQAAGCRGQAGRAGAAPLDDRAIQAILAVYGDGNGDGNLTIGLCYAVVAGTAVWAIIGMIVVSARLTQSLPLHRLHLRPPASSWFARRSARRDGRVRPTTRPYSQASTRLCSTHFTVVERPDRRGTETAAARRRTRSAGRRVSMRETLEKEREFRGAARSAHLRYVSDTEHGFARRRRGKSFTYVRPNGKALRDPAHVARIRSLAIPPAWKDVWICPTANGHLQATGRDARGRKQYRYHPRWRDAQDQNKYERIIAFARNRCPRFVAPSPGICANAACRARRCSRPRSSCSRRR